jgi:hypothetical protein
MFASFFIFGVTLLLGSVAITSAQDGLSVPQAVGDYSGTDSTTYKYCVRLLKSTGNAADDTTVVITRCFQNASDEAIYRQASLDNGWKGLGLIYRQTNFGTGDGYLRYMGNRVCSAGNYNFSQSQIPLTFRGSNLKSAKAITGNCEDVKLWENTNFTGTSIDCVPTGYCPNLTSFTMESLRFKD